MTKRFLLGCVVTAGVLSGCYENDPLYCANAPLHTCSLLDAAVDTGCTSNAECSGSAAVCDVTGTKTCVQCAGSDNTACVGTSPTCGSDDMCHACTTHADCASAACLPDGSCGTDANVAYVDPTGTDNTMCTKAMPCTKATKALATTRPFVKFHGTTDEAPTGVTVSGAQHVTFLADPGATLTRGTGGAILTVKDDNTSLSVFDLAISNAPNTASGFGLVVPIATGAPSVSLTRTTLSNNPGGGISSSGGSLTISQSTLSGNAGGGIKIDATATFVIVGNVFFNNGGNGTTVGGVDISTTQSSGNRLDFNSFSKNTTQDGIGPAIQCVAGTFTARNNILSGNGTLTQMDQTGGTCAHTFSIVLPGALPAGTGNSASDPMFVNTTTGDLHIQTGSPARNMADPGSDLAGVAAKDIDGDVRTAPADIGADAIP